MLRQHVVEALHLADARQVIELLPGVREVLTDTLVHGYTAGGEFSLYQCDLREGTLTPDDSKTALLDDATAFYQSAAWLYTSGGLKKDAPPPQPLPTQMELQPQPQQKTQGE